MRSAATTVAEYIEALPDDWKPAVKKLRSACRRELKGYTETIQYGMPSYARDGQIEVSFAKQARYLSLYVLKQPVFDEHRPQLAGLSLGKGCVRYTRPDQINWAVVAELLADTNASADRAC